MNQPRLVTELPGPEARKLIAAEDRVASTSLIKEYPLVAARGQGIMIEDVDGNRFLDFMSGIAVTLTGHCHPEVVSRVNAQAARLLHVCGTDFHYGSYGELCNRLAALGPGEGAWRVYLGNSGAEAVEAAIKLARYHTGRPGLIAFEGAFHGRTYGAMSLTNSKVVQRAGFGPLLPGVYHVPYASCRDCAGGSAHRSCRDVCVGSWAENLFRRTVAPREVAAIIVEPVQGEGGHRRPRPEFFRRLRSLCDEHGMLLIADEIQTGMGRTGAFFALEHAGVVPDIITLAKGLGSGLPISATMAREEVMTWPRGSHGSTFGGNPVSCAAANATLDLILGGLMKNARQTGAYLRARLEDMARAHAAIAETRGLGLMLALAFGEAAQAAAFEQACYRRGLLVLVCGARAVRLAPPMILTQSDVDTACGIMEAVLTEDLP